jgi:hypothetical protein
MDGLGVRLGYIVPQVMAQFQWVKSRFEPCDFGASIFRQQFGPFFDSGDVQFMPLQRHYT